MKTIIAEKPSVAREIARIVGATKREEGYFEKCNSLNGILLPRVEPVSLSVDSPFPSVP